MSKNTIKPKQVNCSSCGGDLQFDPQSQSAVCTFCQSNHDIVAGQNTEVMQPSGIIPFSITKKQCYEAFLNWLSIGDLTPDDALQKSVLSSVVGMYIPFYLYKATYEVSYQTTDLQEFFHDQDFLERTWNRFKNARRIHGDATHIGCASQTLTEDQIAFCQTLVGNNAELKPFNDIYVQGFEREPINAKINAVYTQRVKSAVNESTKQIVHKKLSEETLMLMEDKEKILSRVSINSECVGAIYLPLWVATYTYEGKSRQVLINGQKMDRELQMVQGICGEYPIDHSRAERIRSAWFSAKIAGWMSVSGVIFALWNWWSFRSVLVVFISGVIGTLALSGIAVYREKKLITTSEKQRQSILNYLLKNSI